MARNTGKQLFSSKQLFSGFDGTSTGLCRCRQYARFVRKCIFSISREIEKPCYHFYSEQVPSKSSEAIGPPPAVLQHSLGNKLPSSSAIVTAASCCSSSRTSQRRLKSRLCSLNNRVRGSAAALQEFHRRNFCGHAEDVKSSAVPVGLSGRRTFSTASGASLEAIAPQAVLQLSARASTGPLQHSQKFRLNLNFCSSGRTAC